MKKEYLTLDEIQDMIDKEEHISASEMSMLAAKARELTRIRSHELKRAQKLLDRIEARLAETGDKPPE